MKRWLGPLALLVSASTLAVLSTMVVLVEVLRAGLVLAYLVLIAFGLVCLRRLAHRRPRPPRNVRVVFPDGREQPLEVVYGGRLDDGGHRWMVTELLPLVEGLSVTVEDLAAGHEIRWGCYIGDPPPGS